MLKLMLVEDDNNLREIYEARLQAEGYEIVTARDGEEALVVAKAEKPDLIISDVMMPKISGFEMLDILRNTDGLKAVKVIMLTALGQTDDQQRADRLGADRYLVKSQVTLEDIVKVTHELLGDAPVAPSAPDAAAVAPAADPTPTAPQADPVVAAPPEPAVTPVSEPITPVAMPVVSEPPSTPPIAPVAPPTDSSATNDKLMNEAVNDLMASTPKESPEESPESENNDSVPVAGKKVIEPIASDSTKPDLQTLLAAEEAKEVGAQPSEPLVVEAPPAEPAPQPTVIPEPAAASAAPTPDTTLPQGSDTPQSTAEEKAAAEARIEDFVVGADPVVAAPPEPAVTPVSGTSVTPDPNPVVAVTEPTSQPTAPTPPPAPTTPPAPQTPGVDAHSVAL